jgi:methanethiol S-methyltransferase
VLLKTGVVWILLAFALYGLVHSWLASLRVKNWVARRFGSHAAAAYRLAYNIFAVLSFLPVLALVVLLPDAPLYAFPSVLKLPARFVQGAAAAGLLLSVAQTGLVSFLGLDALLGKPAGAEKPHLVTTGLYRWVRHPIYFFALLFLWAQPQVSWNSFAFIIGSSLYLWIGSIFEERKLLAEFGQVYADYRDRTPALIPGLRWGKKRTPHS